MGDPFPVDRKALDREDAIQALLDKEAIRETLCRYARGLDRLDAEMTKSAWHEDAVQVHGEFEGPAQMFVEHAIDFLRHHDAQSHMMGNYLIELDGDVAQVESYGIAFQRMNADGGVQTDSLLGCRLLDRMEKRDGEWKIARRRTVTDWCMDAPTNVTWGDGTLAVMNTPAGLGRKDRTDPSYDPS